MRAAYSYQGDATCAADGMCQEKCPVKINTGSLIKSIRADELASGASGSRADAMSMVRRDLHTEPQPESVFSHTLAFSWRAGSWPASLPMGAHRVSSAWYRVLMIHC